MRRLGQEAAIHAIGWFVIGIVTLGELVMRFIGRVDNELSVVMLSMGIVGGMQVIVLLLLSLVLVVLAMRTVGGLFGWVVLILMILMLSDRILPRMNYTSANITNQTHAPLLSGFGN